MNNIDHVTYFGADQTLPADDVTPASTATHSAGSKRNSATVHPISIDTQQFVYILGLVLIKKNLIDLSPKINFD